jgi:hypothetical protein
MEEKMTCETCYYFEFDLDPETTGCTEGFCNLCDFPVAAEDVAPLCWEMREED